MLCATLAWAPPSLAAGPADARPRALALDRVVPSLDSKGLLTLDRPATLEHLTPAFGMWINQAADLRAGTGGDVDHALSGHIRVGLGLFDRLQVSAGMPLVLVRSEARDISSEGAGPGFLALKARILGEAEADGPSVGVLLSASIDVGEGGDFRADEEGGLRAALLLEERLGRFSLAAEGGLTFGRSGRLDGADLGDELEVGLGAEWAINNGAAGLALEAIGRLPVEGDHAEPSVEALAGLRAHLDSQSSLVLAGGLGYGDATGTPAWRVLVGWLLEARDRDTDGDGIDDARDACPRRPEDFDDFDDSDGCPDPDNDDDGVVDDRDSCPELAEDRNGYRDDDGCPDGSDDRDADGIPDVSDACPGKAEDADGHEDLDGCPDPDNDGDGVADEFDKCPRRSEDHDLFEDDDGCPDPDNDDDGLVDERDECPNQPEDYVGLDDTDGCPEAGAVVAAPKPAPAALPPPPPPPPQPLTVVLPRGVPAAVLGATKVEVGEPIRFARSSARVLPESLPILRTVAAIMADYPAVRLRIEGHTDSRGKHEENLTLSRNRASAVMQHLIAAGVAPARLRAMGFGPELPIAPNDTPEGRARNRRVDFMVDE